MPVRITYVRSVVVKSDLHWILSLVLRHLLGQCKCLCPDFSVCLAVSSSVFCPVSSTTYSSSLGAALLVQRAFLLSLASRTGVGSFDTAICLLAAGSAAFPQRQGGADHSCLW